MSVSRQVRRAVRTLPLPERQRSWLRRFEARRRLASALERNGLVEALSVDVEQWAPFVRFAAPGHFYSPIPRLDELRADAAELFSFDVELAGIDLRIPEQLAITERIATELNETSSHSAPLAFERYSVDNPSFGIGDATMLEGMLRLHAPSQIVEIGSGYSSARILDVVERHLPGTTVTFVEPHTDLLRSLMREGDVDRCHIIERRAQDVPVELLDQLESGDVLLIDSTHVVRTGSDVCHLILKVLPALAPGVIVHVHDIFWPFELPEEWVEEGRQWSECYLMRAFLTGNHDWEIVLFNDYIGRYHVPFVQKLLPQFLDNPGGSLWLRRVS